MCQSHQLNSARKGTSLVEGDFGSLWFDYEALSVQAALPSTLPEDLSYPGIEDEDSITAYDIIYHQSLEVASSLHSIPRMTMITFLRYMYHG
jgi:hypothetical protein